MVTYWKTEPLIMDQPQVNRPSQPGLHRPQIYVHVEFGVSWTGRHVPNNHAVTYRSRGLRERSPNFPREVPAPNTNYLAAIADYQRQRDQPHGGNSNISSNVNDLNNISHNHNHSLERRPESYHQDYGVWPQQPQHRHHHHYHRNQHLLSQDQQHHHPQYQLQLPSRQPEQQQQQQQLVLQQPRQHEQPQHQHHYSFGDATRDQLLASDERRSSRDSRSSHERGHSAPPPLSGSPWDITRLDASAMPSSSAQVAVVSPGNTTTASSRQPPMIWKALPEIPSRFRLGEDGMPWSSFSPDVDPDDARLSPIGGGGSFHGSYYGSYHGSYRSRQQEEDQQEEAPYINSPTVITIESPRFEEAPFEMPRMREHDPQRTRELEALSAAMMTIDNGFENQWWNQGSRETMSASLLPPATSSPPPRPPSRPTAAARSEASRPQRRQTPQLQQQQQPQPQTQTPQSQGPSQRQSRIRSPRSQTQPSLPSPQSQARSQLQPQQQRERQHTSPGLASVASLGWTMAYERPDDWSLMPAAVPHQLVSPVTPYGSPPPVYSGLSRSMSTRSEELFFTGGRYA